jgi:hypothetical protein
MTETTTWTCGVVDCAREAVVGWGEDLFPPVEVCDRHLDELAGGALAIHTHGGTRLLVKPLTRGTI